MQGRCGGGGVEWGTISGQVSVAVLIDKFVSATALIKFEEVQRALIERKSKEVLLPRHLLRLRRTRAAMCSCTSPS
jgi:hypothetical protein